jgi:predicted lipoprotein with Yx(FWY)xxD motif
MPVVQGMKRSIKYSLSAVLVLGAAALVLAACGGGNDGGNATAASSGAGSGIVSTKSVDGMNVLVDSQGKTLYSAKVEKGMIRCADGCTSFWKPLSASAKQSKTASADLHLKLGVVNRPDGGSQMTFKGLPLYTFTQEGAGQLKGNGFTDDFQGTHFKWAAATTAGGGSGSGGSKSSSEKSEYSSPY